MSAIAEQKLRALFDDARAAWPGVEIDRAQFARFLGERAQGAELDELRTRDLYLACACAMGDARAHRAFEEQLLAKVPSFLARLRPPPFLVDEVQQHLREALLLPADKPGLTAYSGRGALVSWLRVIAVRAALRLQREPRAEAQHPEAAGPPGPELEYLKLRYRGEYERALQDALRSLSDRERLFLRLHHGDGLSIDRIGALYRMHRSTVARRLAASRRKLLDGTRERLRERLKLTDTEFESLLAIVRSQLLVSVRAALGRR
jgi:RNA polymerase sigma-70 factor (ECF subfamily)